MFRCFIVYLVFTTCLIRAAHAECRSIIELDQKNRNALIESMDSDGGYLILMRHSHKGVEDLSDDGIKYIKSHRNNIKSFDNFQNDRFLWSAPSRYGMCNRVRHTSELIHGKDNKCSSDKHLYIQNISDWLSITDFNNKIYFIAINSTLIKDFFINRFEGSGDFEMAEGIVMKLVEGQPVCKARFYLGQLVKSGGSAPCWAPEGTIGHREVCE
ncbi:MAG: hypothetical protein AAF557_13870 [Pseudomonadota bacterium]